MSDPFESFCRQQRELDQLVEYEVKRAQMQAKAEAKLAKQNERARKLAAAKVEKEKAWRAALRGQEINRLALEKEEEQKKKRADKARAWLIVVKYSWKEKFQATCSRACIHMDTRTSTVCPCLEIAQGDSK